MKIQTPAARQKSALPFPVYEMGPGKYGKVSLEIPKQMIEGETIGGDFKAAFHATAARTGKDGK